jgi:hypothetical protein
MKKITAREFARNQSKAVNELGPYEKLAVTKHGRIILMITKPEAAKRRRLRATDMLRDLQKLPMTDADGDEILRKFAGEALF